MTKNLKFYFIFLFLLSCGYTPVYQINKNSNIKIDIINFSNFKDVLNAGANIIVSGTTIFKENNGDIKKNIDFLKSI